jgi:hypothetical protein
MYSYICSSSALTKFIPVFVISNILLSFVLPVILIALMYGSGKSSRMKAVCMSFLPPILFPSDHVTKRLFSPHVIMSKLLHHIALLLTFGVACPPLAVAILTTVCITTMAWQLLTGRYICQRREALGLSPFPEKSRPDTPADHQQTFSCVVRGRSLDNGRSSDKVGNEQISKGEFVYEKEMFTLNSLCDGVWLCPQMSIWVIIDCTAFFSSLLVFDVSGDRSGWLVASLSFSLPMLLLPLVLRAVFVYKCRPPVTFFLRKDKKKKSQPLSVDVVHSVQTSPLACQDIL